MSNVSDKITLNNTTHSTIIIPSATTNITLTLPTSTDTLIGLTTTDILTNKTLKSPIVGGSITIGAWGTNGVQSQFTANTYTDNTSAAGTVTNNMINTFAQPTLATSANAVTYTNASTVYIAGAPIAGTNTTLTNTTALQINNTSSGVSSLRLTGTSGNSIDFQGVVLGAPYLDKFANLIFPSLPGGYNWHINDNGANAVLTVFIDSTKVVRTFNNTLDGGSGSLGAKNITGSGQFKLTGTTYPNILFPTNNKILVGEPNVVGDTSNTIYQIGSGVNTKNMIIALTKSGIGTSYIMHDGSATWFASDHSGSFNFMSVGTYGATNLATSISGSTQWASISSSGVTSTSLILTNSTFNNTMSSTTLAGNSTFNLPPTTGTSGQLLQTDGSGNTSWVTQKIITQTTFTTGSSTFTVPSGALDCLVTFWGAGGGGGNSTGGGGGGGSVMVNLPLLAGNIYSYSIGGGGATNTNGGNTTITFNGTTVTAGGGSAGVSSSGNGGNGGSAPSSSFGGFALNGVPGGKVTAFASNTGFFGLTGSAGTGGASAGGGGGGGYNGNGGNGGNNSGSTTGGTATSGSGAGGGGGGGSGTGGAGGNGGMTFTYWV